ncbi:hypothetical protein J2W21_001872 [Sinomonas atrocyanea]|uniref:hypothetical protein n=1 Tax=Sinomonas atrocyanea TaxID=37927 RepID=UPI00277E2FF7|nr:hypothetical protein [Sinomonas atrocyanea]MDP9884362.1 hypothetical protein [Sinomonas atrocyanea]
MDRESRLGRRRSAAAALAGGPVAVGLGLVAHLVSGGAAPPAGVLAALAVLVSLLAAAAARAPLAPWMLALGSGALQQVLHLAFTALAGPSGPLFPAAGHAHHGAVSTAAAAAATPGPGVPLDFHLLVVAHIAAALLTVLALTAATRVAASLQAPGSRQYRHEALPSAGIP